MIQKETHQRRPWTRTSWPCSAKRPIDESAWQRDWPGSTKDRRKEVVSDRSQNSVTRASAHIGSLSHQLGSVHLGSSGDDLGFSNTFLRGLWVKGIPKVFLMSICAGMTTLVTTLTALENKFCNSSENLKGVEVVDQDRDLGG